MKKIWEERVRYFYKSDIKIIKFINRVIDSEYFGYTFLFLFGFMTIFGVLYAFFSNVYFLIGCLIGAIPLTILIFFGLAFLLTGLLYVPYLDIVIKLHRKGRTLFYARVRGIIVQLLIWVIIIILIKNYW